MNKYIDLFLEQVCQEIKYKKIHGEVSKELMHHIEDLMIEYMDSGMNEDEAIKKAIEQMGNPVEIGQKLHKTHKPKTEWSILGLISALILIGGGVLYSVASDSASLMSSERFAISFLVYSILGIAIFFVCYFMDYTKLEKYSLHIFLATLIFFIIIQGSPHKLNGVPYLVIGPFSMMPMFLAVPFLLIAFSGLINRWATGNLKDMAKLISLAGLAVLCYLLTPSLANALLLGAGFLALITLAILNKSFKGSKIAYLSSIYGGGLAVLGLFFLSNPYGLKRLSGFLSPQSDPLGAGYVSIMVRNILSGAKWWGKGEGLYLNHTGNQYGFTVPGINTEFILIYIISVFGWIAGIFVISIALFTVLRMFLAAQKLNARYGKNLTNSIITVFALQIVSNILMNLGLFPIVDISLPFISYGATNFITNMALVGLMLGVYRRKDLVSSETILYL